MIDRDDIKIVGGHAEFAPQFQLSLERAVLLIFDAIAYCRFHEHRRLLLNIKGLTGFRVPTLAERYWFVNEWAVAGGSKVVLAMVAPEELIDPEKIGVTMAYNAGMLANVFLDDNEALAWLNEAGRTPPNSLNVPGSQQSEKARPV